MRNSVLAAALALASAAPAAESPEAGQSGQLRVAVYTEHAPFSDEGKGVDVEVGNALAAKLGLPAEIIPFKDGESVDDDLRNIVWKGHYLWKGKLADVMMHVPVDPDLARKNPQVRIVAPYFRERLVVARSKSRIPRLETFEVFTREKIGVQFNTIEDHYLSARSAESSATTWSISSPSRKRRRRCGAETWRRSWAAAARSRRRSRKAAATSRSRSPPRPAFVPSPGTWEWQSRRTTRNSRRESKRRSSTCAWTAASSGSSRNEE